MPGMDASFLMKLLQLNPEGINNMSNMAAMKASPPQIGPSSPGILAPGAFAGIMDPTVGQVPQGAAPMPMGVPPAPGAQGTANGQINPQLNPGMNAGQAYMLGQQMNQPQLQFPGTAAFGRPGQISMAPIGVPSGNNQHVSLSQILGR